MRLQIKKHSLLSESTTARPFPAALAPHADIHFPGSVRVVKRKKTVKDHPDGGPDVGSTTKRSNVSRSTMVKAEEEHCTWRHVRVLWHPCKYRAEERCEPAGGCTSLQMATFRRITHDHGNRARSFKVEIASADQSGPGVYGGWGRGPRGSKWTSLLITD